MYTGLQNQVIRQGPGDLRGLPDDSISLPLLLVVSFLREVLQSPSPGYQCVCQSQESSGKLGACGSHL
jgi:hypothetical protein